jgi:hypothetical protein
MPVKYAVLFFAALALVASPAWAGYEEGVLAYESRNYGVAYEEFRTLSAGGHAGAEFMLGAMYFYGKGKPRDNALAATWFHKSARKGNVAAQLAYGSLHTRGWGVPRDLVEAYMWLTLVTEEDVSSLQRQAVLLRDEAAHDMTAAEIDRARRKAQQWRPARSGLTVSY